MIDRTAQRGDHPTVRNVGLDAVGGQRMKQVRTDLRDLPLPGRVAKMARVPVDALFVVRAEELGFLDAVGQIDAAFEYAMQPGRAGASGTGSDDGRQPALDSCGHILWLVADAGADARLRRFTTDRTAQIAG